MKIELLGMDLRRMVSKVDSAVKAESSIKISVGPNNAIPQDCVEILFYSDSLLEFTAGNHYTPVMNPPHPFKLELTRRWFISISFMILLISVLPGIGQESLPVLKDDQALQTLEELWKGFDPCRDSLNTEILKEWEEEGVILQVIRYDVGVFKGEKSVMAAIYGYPKGAIGLPGLVQIHGGGQYADYRAALSNAKRGYATISIAWAGRINAPDYRVGPNEVDLFWQRDTENKNFKITTDWGALDGYHAPSKNAGNVFTKIPEPASWTLDSVKSPRNNGWFLCALAARRALTFLEQQPQVDPERLGVYGHSMGGKITVLTTGSDDRVKAAAPSCGGISDRYNSDPLFRATLGDDPYLKQIDCPIVFLSPSNDFHGRINDLQTALGEIRTQDWRITCSPHHNHQDSAEYEVATQLWFDEHLKNSFQWPETPKTILSLDTEDQVPSFIVYPDLSLPIESVEIFYTQDADPQLDRVGVINRFWLHASTEKQDDFWKAELPIATDSRPLWVYANVVYKLDQPVSGAGYYYRSYTAHTFNLSSTMAMALPGDLKSARVVSTLRPDVMIEAFDLDWQKEWFTYKSDQWPRRTHKVNDPLWAAPAGAELSIQVRSEQANQLVIGIDGYAAEVKLDGGDSWQTITLTHCNFSDATGANLTTWRGIKELRLSDKETLRLTQPAATRILGADWKGDDPEFRELKWLTRTSAFVHPGISHTQESIDFVKTQIASGQQPWEKTWEIFQALDAANLDWRSNPRPHVERGAYNRPNIGSSDFTRDANAAYVQALLWALTEKEAHAEKAAQIIDAWSCKLESISNHDARLLVGMEGYKFCNAAELLKHTWDGWPLQNQEQFESMLREIFYSVIKDFYPSANGNWDASMIQTMMAMGVYLDDRAMFNRGVNYYLNGSGNGAVRNYFKPSGQCQETGRDQGHTQMGLDFLACTCEIAWNQGIDLYSAFDIRLLKGFEYTSKYNLGLEVPYAPYRSFEGRYFYKSISEKARGRLRPMYEKVLSHYQNRKGLKAEFTRLATMKLREDLNQARDRQAQSSSLEILMFAR